MFFVDTTNSRNYTKEFFVDTLHSFPHVNFTFEEANSTFDPESVSYRESLVFLFSLPVLWVVLTLLVSSCCLCYQCIKKPPSKEAKSTCLSVFTIIFLVLTMSVLAVGLYGNEESGKGVSSFRNSLEDVNTTIEDSKYTLGKLDYIAEAIAQRSVERVNATMNSISDMGLRYSLQQLNKLILMNCTNARKDIANIKKKIPSIPLSETSEEVKTYEFYRWLSTVIVLCVTLLILLLMLVAVCKKSRCFFMIMIFFGFFNLLIIWVAMGIYLAGAVAGGDLCYDPNRYVISRASFGVEKDVIKTYVNQCPKGSTSLDKMVADAQEAVLQANQSFARIEAGLSRVPRIPALDEALGELETNLGYAQGNVTKLFGDVSCSNIHQIYIRAVQSVCNTSLVGLVLILLCLVVTGFLLIFIQCLLPRLWRLSGKRKGYRPVDDNDPFAPRPPPYNGYGSIHSPSGAFSHERSYSLNDGPETESLTMHHGPPNDSPPPAYRPVNAGEEYVFGHQNEYS